MTDRWPVLTIKQPWVFAILHGGKTVENRTWEMTHRGPLWLHAGARSGWDSAGAQNPLVRDAWDQYVRRIPSWPGLPSSDVELGRATTLLPFGAVVAAAVVIDCHQARDCWVREDHEQGSTITYCSPWAVRTGWHIALDDVRPLAKPIQRRGHLGLWYLDEVEAAARKQLEASHA